MIRPSIVLALAIGLALTASLVGAQTSDQHAVAALRIGPGSGGFVGPLALDSGFGASLTSLGDVDGNGVPDLAVGAPTHGEKGAVAVLLLNPDGSVLSDTLISFGQAGFAPVLVVSQHAEFGRGLTGPGDLNGDGVPDLVVSGRRPFSLWALMLARDGSVRRFVEIPLDHLGSGDFQVDVDTYGDVDGDGQPEFVVGLAETAGTQRRILLLQLDDDLALDGWVELTAPPPGLAVGYSHRVVAPGDLDGDGLDDVLAPFFSLQSGPTGLVHHLDAEGQLLGTSLYDTAVANQLALEGLLRLDHLEPVGDLNGDGVVDHLSNGASLVGSQPQLWVLLNGEDGALRAPLVIQPGSDSFPGTLAPPQAFGGGAVAALGDLDGDGRVEVAVGSPGDGRGDPLHPNSPGAVWILSLASRWFDLGRALPGADGEPPHLVGSGGLAAGDATSLSLSGGPPHAPALLWLGLESLDAPFSGGVLVPAPQLALGLPLDGQGALQLRQAWPAGVPALTNLFLQLWMEDPSAAEGLAASNALQARTP